MDNPVPAAVVTTSGRFHDNRRGTVRVTETALGMAELVVVTPPAFGADAVTVSIVVAGEHLAQLARQLSRAARRDRLRSIEAAS